MRVLGAVLVSVLSIASTARADVELQNDSFVSQQTAVFQNGFVTNEIGASRFVAANAGAHLLKVHFLFGGDTATKTVTLKVWDDTAGADAPGGELFSGDFQVTGSDSAMQELDLVASNVIVPAKFRVGIVFQHDGPPSIARDNDNTIAADRNFIFSAGSWVRSQSLGLTGDWIIRAVVTDPVSGGDSAVAPDAGAGLVCTSNTSCPMGQFCDLAVHACTFECRVDSDCGEGTCNSLGQCVGGGADSGCCRVEHGGAGAVLLGFGVLVLVLRRRRSAR